LQAQMAQVRFQRHTLNNVDVGIRLFVTHRELAVIQRNLSLPEARISSPQELYYIFG